MIGWGLPVSEPALYDDNTLLVVISLSCKQTLMGQRAGMAEIIDLRTVQRSDPPEGCSPLELLEQAEALVLLQEAVLHQFRSTTGQSQADNNLIAVENSLQHLYRHLGLIKRMLS